MKKLLVLALLLMAAPAFGFNTTLTNGTNKDIFIAIKGYVRELADPTDPDTTVEYLLTDSWFKLEPGASRTFKYQRDFQFAVSIDNQDFLSTRQIPANLKGSLLTHPTSEVDFRVYPLANGRFGMIFTLDEKIVESSTDLSADDVNAIRQKYGFQPYVAMKITNNDGNFNINEE